MQKVRVSGVEWLPSKHILSMPTNYRLPWKRTLPPSDSCSTDVARLLRKRFEQHARGSGLTRSQWHVLAYLSQNEGINQSRLADLLDVEPITLGRIVDKLQNFELVERRPHPSDRRIWLLHLTAAALPKLAVLRELGDRTRQEALAGVSESDREQLLKTLKTLKSNLTETFDVPASGVKRASHG